MYERLDWLNFQLDWILLQTACHSRKIHVFFMQYWLPGSAEPYPVPGSQVVGEDAKKKATRKVGGAEKRKKKGQRTCNHFFYDPFPPTLFSPVSSRFIFVFAFSQFSGPDYLGAWNRLPAPMFAFTISQNRMLSKQFPEKNISPYPWRGKEIRDSARFFDAGETCELRLNTVTCLASHFVGKQHRTDNYRTTV